MKNKLLLFWVVSSSMTSAMEPITLLEYFPSELKGELVKYIVDGPPSVQKKVSELIVYSSKKFFYDHTYNQQLITELTAQFPKETFEKPWLAALFLNTPAAKEWLNATPENKWVKGICFINKWDHANSWRADAQGLVREFIWFGNDISSIAKQYYENPLLALMNDQKMASYIAQEYKERHMRSTTVLMYAAYMGSEDLVAKLINLKADINAKNDDGKTALEFAVQGSRPRIADMLQRAGATT